MWMISSLQLVTLSTLRRLRQICSRGLLHLRDLVGPEGIFISQKRYVKELLEAIGMEDYKLISTPMDPNVKLSAHDDSELVDASQYQKLVGSLT